MDSLTPWWKADIGLSDVRMKCSSVHSHWKCKSFMLSLLSVSARVQPNWRVLQEALLDWPFASGTGAGSPGRAGPETPSFGHPEDSNGQTLSGYTLCHQGRRNICLYGRKLKGMNSESWAHSKNSSDVTHTNTNTHTHGHVIVCSSCEQQWGCLNECWEVSGSDRGSNLSSVKQYQILPTTTQRHCCSQGLYWV